MQNLVYSTPHDQSLRAVARLGKTAEEVLEFSVIKEQMDKVKEAITECVPDTSSKAPEIETGKGTEVLRLARASGTSRHVCD